MSQENDGGEVDPMVRLVGKSATAVVKQLSEINLKLEKAEKRSAEIERGVGCLLTFLCVAATFFTLCALFFYSQIMQELK